LPNRRYGDFPGVFEITVVEKGFVTECVDAVIEGDLRPAWRGGTGCLSVEGDAPRRGIEAARCQSFAAQLFEQRQAQQSPRVFVGQVRAPRGAGKTHEEFEDFTIVGQRGMAR
jgi:hypothetical protein